MVRFIIILLLLSTFISCDNKSPGGNYYTHLQWQKYRKDYDFGLLKDKPIEIKESFYININDTTLIANGEANGYEKYKFDSNGEIVFWQQCNKNGNWFIGEMHYNENGFQAKYYSDKDSLKTSQNVSRANTTRLSKNRYLMHSFFDIGPSFILTSFENNGDIVKKEFIADSLKLKDVFKTVIYYYQDKLLQKIETTTNNGFQQLNKYYYSAAGKLDSIHKIEKNKLLEREIFLNNENGDPVSYAVLRVQQRDTFKYVQLQYAYDNHKNWVKRLENKIIGDYAISGKNIHYTLVKREIRY